MSVRSFGHDLEQERKQLPERIYEHAETHGMDPGSNDVLRTIEDLFGETVKSDYEEFISC